MHHLPVFQPLQVLPSPFPLTVKDPGAQSTSSAALPVLLVQRVLPVPQVTGHLCLPVLPPPLLAQTFKYGSVFVTGSKFYVGPSLVVNGQYGQYSVDNSIIYLQLYHTNGQYMDLMT